MTARLCIRSASQEADPRRRLPPANRQVSCKSQPTTGANRARLAHDPPNQHSCAVPSVMRFPHGPLPASSRRWSPVVLAARGTSMEKGVSAYRTALVRRRDPSCRSLTRLGDGMREPTGEPCRAGCASVHQSTRPPEPSHPLVLRPAGRPDLVWLNRLRKRETTRLGGGPPRRSRTERRRGLRLVLASDHLLDAP
jgi:hypothetical protein